ncbi:hypothetical protein BABINDRAFT_118083 [Babjeviella inositovora NRRL Y-12698]|uniref:Uncharacterized protein n=1 Tax=Babjeviella inositovora NRRL Y-12698 TaxID=984486 RepID=A0A1E3QT91_9ASCO|nr:uncharacterized protein BABINDRAFT_118083 [Babjeviella inositovora NRRL Y-12698]ODQ80909.1 hypothetical protein BABINDRAFT_118083 [Babjeviella inositovora NRRL Y-12698]
MNVDISTWHPPRFNVRLIFYVGSFKDFNLLPVQTSNTSKFKFIKLNSNLYR